MVAPPPRFAPNAPEGRVLERLRGWIEERELRPGNRLPSERDLAQRLQVSRFVVRAALSRLEREGLIRSASQRIRVVAEPPLAADTVLSETIALVTSLRHLPVPSEERPPETVQPLYFGIAEAVHAAGLNALTIPPARLAAGRIERLVAERVRGWIVLEDALIAAAGGRAVLDELAARRAPLVVYGDVLAEGELASIPCDRVISDHRSGCQQLTAWLIARGCRRILRVWRRAPDTPASLHWLAQRDLGYHDACRAAGIEALPALDVPTIPYHDPHGDLFARQVRATAGFLIEPLGGSQPVDAIMVISDGVVFDVAAACRLLGKDPQRDLAIVGYDNYWADCSERLRDPITPLATVDKRQREIGRELVRLLLERASGAISGPPHTRVVAPELVIVGAPRTS